MNWKKSLALIMLSFILSLLDISFFASLSIGGASIVSTYVVIITLALLFDSKKLSNELLVFETSSIVIFSIFSSVPVWLLFFSFFLVPGMILYFRNNYFRTPTVPISIIFFVISNFLFEFSLLLYFGEASQNGFQALLYYILINTIAGVAIYYIANSFMTKRVEIKF